MKVLKEVVVSCNDLTTHIVTSFSSKAFSTDAIAKDIMKNGCWSQPSEDIAIFVPPGIISTIKFVRTEVPDDKLEEEGYGPPDEK